MASRDDVFKAFGALSLQCQMLERALTAHNLLLQSIVYWGKGTLETASARAKLDRKKRSTLGQSAMDVHGVLSLPELKAILNDAVEARNFLQHDFFHAFTWDFSSDHECSAMLQKTVELTIPISKAYQILEDLLMELEPHLREAGFDVGT